MPRIRYYKYRTTVKEVKTTLFIVHANKEKISWDEAKDMIIKAIQYMTYPKVDWTKYDISKIKPYTRLWCYPEPYASSNGWLYDFIIEKEEK